MAVGYANNRIPFLTWMVDAFTIDQTKHYVAALQNRTTNNKPSLMTVNQWAQQNAFMLQLRWQDNAMWEKLVWAMKVYIKRIMPRLQYQADNAPIDDDVREVVDVISAVPNFIKWLMKQQASKVSPPFCIDLTFAMMEVESMNDDDGDDDDDDEDYDDGLDMDDGVKPNQDTIGDFQERLKGQNCAFLSGDIPQSAHQLIDDAKSIDDARSPRSNTKALTGASRYLGEFFNRFRDVLSKKHAEKKEDDHHSYDAASYPHNKRFGIFVDRRKTQKAAVSPRKAMRSDHITFYEVFTRWTLSIDVLAVSAVCLCSNESIRGQWMEALWRRFIVMNPSGFFKLRTSEKVMSIDGVSCFMR